MFKHSTGDSCNNLKAMWQKNLATDIEDDEWSDFISNVRKTWKLEGKYTDITGHQLDFTKWELLITINAEI